MVVRIRHIEGLTEFADLPTYQEWSLNMVGNASAWRYKIRELTDNLVMTFKYMRDDQNDVND